MTKNGTVLAVCVLMLLAPHPGQSQTAADPTLAAAIAKIKAIDNHAHPERALSAGEADTEWDAFPENAYEPPRKGIPPVTRRPSYPMLLRSWQALWQYPHNDTSEEHVKALIETKHRVIKEKGDSYPEWVLDQLGIDVMLANRVSMGRGLTSPRFRWVAYADALMFPLSTAAVQRARPRYAGFYQGLEKGSKKALTDAGKDRTPPSLRAWLSGVVTPTLEKYKRDGAVAIKFTAAYYRPLDFAPVAETEAAAIYARSRGAGGPREPEDYRKLQDFIFFHIAREAGRLQLPVHIHCATGPGAQFMMGGTNPLLLERAMSELADTTFVLVHGGWPFTREVTGLLFKSNVYADISVQTFLLTPHGLSEVLRSWLEYIPEKVLFGTDTFAGAPQASWEEFGWLATTTAREGLALALTGMKNDGEVSDERAIELARMVLHNNAAKLYNIQ